MSTPVRIKSLEGIESSDVPARNRRSYQGGMHVRTILLPLPLFFLFTSLLIFQPGAAHAAENICIECHEDLAKAKVVHAALEMGCTSCHGAIDAGDVPHKKTNKSAKGLSSEQPQLCYDCHDKAKFTKKTVHAAIDMGCTGCHDPHSSKNAKLLKTSLPELCYGCHEKEKFSGKSTHSPVAEGDCTGCHDPHSSDAGKLLASAQPDLCFNCHDKAAFSKKTVHMPVTEGCMECHSPHAGANVFLLRKPMNNLCIECHNEQSKGGHVLSGFGKPHPLSGKPDPSRPGKEMSCASCHNPHSSDLPILFLEKGICKRCHKNF